MIYLKQNHKISLCRFRQLQTNITDSILTDSAVTSAGQHPLNTVEVSWLQHSTAVAATFFLFFLLTVCYI